MYIATKADLAGIHLSAGNTMELIEKEVAVHLRPLDFAEKASIKITADQGRAILKGMGISIPGKIAKADITAVLKELPRLTKKQIQTFYEKAAALAKPQ